MAAEAAKASGSQASNPIVANNWNTLLAFNQFYHEVYQNPWYYVLAAKEVAVQAAVGYERPHKRRKTEASVVGQPQESTVTHLWNDRRRNIFKPYSGLESANHPRQSQLPLKRRNDGLPAIPNYNKGSVGSSRTHVIQPDRGCTIGNLFPEILSIIFEYLDTQSKGRAAQVRTIFSLDF